MAKNYLKIADKYAQDIIDGKIPSTGYVLKMCENYFAMKKDDTLMLDLDEPLKMCEFFEELIDPRNPPKNQNDEPNKFTLYPYQILSLITFYGFKDKETGLRKHSRIFISVARKSGKTTFIALQIIWHIMTVPAAYAVAAASDAESSKIVWDTATKIIQMNLVKKDLTKPCQEATPTELSLKWFPRMHLNPMTCEIKSVNIVTNSLSTFTSIAYKNKKPDGLNASILCIDELKNIGKSNYVNTLLSGSGAQREPIEILIGTAPPEHYGVYYDHYKMAVDSLTNKSLGHIYPMLYIHDTEHDNLTDWDQEDAWIRANPALPHLPSLRKNMKTLIAGARTSLDAKRSLQSDNLNCIGIAQGEEFFRHSLLKGLQHEWKDPMKYYDKYRGEEESYIGIDFARRYDTAAIVLLSKNYKEDGKFYIWTKIILPRKIMNEQTPFDDLYKRYYHSGDILLSEKDTITVDEFLGYVEYWWNMSRAKEVIFDRYHDNFIQTALLEKGIKCSKAVSDKSRKTRGAFEVQDLIEEKKLLHCGNQAMLWMFSNCKAKIDTTGNVEISKPTVKHKIDGYDALFCAIQPLCGINNDKNKSQEMGIIL